MKILLAIIAFLVICSGVYNTWLVTQRTGILHDPRQPHGDMQTPPKQVSSHT